MNIDEKELNKIISQLPEISLSKQNLCETTNINDVAIQAIPIECLECKQIPIDTVECDKCEVLFCKLCLISH